MGQLDGQVQDAVVRSRIPVGLTENVVPNGAGQVDLARRVGQDIRCEQSTPEHTQVLAFRDIHVRNRGWMTSQLKSDSIERLTVSLGLHGELQSLETVVLREIGHKGTEGVGRRCSIVEHLF